jgi:glycosyltransferase involved in cell wall biosynthesis
MKITIIGPAFPYRGGIATFSERLAQQLQSEGHEVKIHTFSLQYPNFLFPGKSQYSNETPVYNLNIERSIHSMNPMNWIVTGKKIRKEKPDLVIVKYWLPFMGPCLGTILRFIKKDSQIKTIGFIHNMIPHEKRPGDTVFSKYFIKPVDAFLSMSKSVLEDIQLFDKHKPKKLTTHPIYDNFGEITNRETALEKLNLDNTFKYILFFGLIRDYKGLDLLIEAFANPSIDKSKIKLIIAGEYYSNKEVYQNLISKYNLEDHIIQVDRFIPNSEVADYFNASDLVAQPYKSATQSGVTQIAYHFNKPMLITKVGGLEEICPDGKVGYVVQPNPAEIAEGINKFFNDTNLEEMTANLISEKQKYSWSALTEKVYALYTILNKQ